MVVRMKKPFVSIVVCTYNRNEHLSKCLESLQRQTYKNAEIVVVNGPSTDGTDSVLCKYDNVRVVNQKSLNGLSYARNLGICSSKGEIIAFIDDDAVADENWLAYLIGSYTSDLVGGVGGLVYGSQKTHIQFDNGTIDKCGIPKTVKPDTEKLRKNDFRVFMGTNCSFRRKALYDTGGFDPYFKYYHDESDLCVRIIKEGYSLIYQKNAFVIHEMVEGHNRKSPYDLNWSEIIKNVIYFTLKNFSTDFHSYSTRPIYSLYWWTKYFASAFLKKRINMKDFCSIYFQVLNGSLKGYKDGLLLNLLNNNQSSSNLNLSVNETKSLADETQSLVAIPEKDIKDSKLKIVLLSQEYSKNCNGGICRYTYDLAHGLAELGNTVHVISKTETEKEYNYVDENVFVHKINPVDTKFLSLTSIDGVSDKNIAYSYAVCLKLLELVESEVIDIVEAPLWDAEGFVFSLVKNIPLVIRIETPLFKVAEIQNWEITRDLKIANWMEGEAVRRADKVITISAGIGNLIRDRHHISQDNMVLCPLGIELPIEHLLMQNNDKTFLNILFVGRLEKRKGIEILFKSIPYVVDKLSDVIFTIVGKDTNSSPVGGSYKKYLLDTLDKKYHKNVDFIGFVTDDKLKEYYSKCTIFVAPSLYESFGLIYLEAMAWGKPVIGCSVGGVPEVIDDGETGLLIPPNDEQSLADAIIRLLTNNELRVQIGRNALKKMKSDFSKETMAMKSMQIFKSTIENNMKRDSTKNLDLLNKISEHVSDQPFEYYPICELTNVNKWYSVEWAKLQYELLTPIYYPPNFVHRKTWEYIQCIYGLDKLGVLNENSVALGVGAGHEVLMYYFSNKVKKVVATDLYDESSIWVTNAKEGDPEILTKLDKFAPFPYQKDRLEVKRMDGRKLDFPDNSFDFIWSCSSIEHFGGHGEAAKSMREMERVLKPGGILALATEFVIEQDVIPGFNSSHDHYFNLEAVYTYLIASHNLKLVQDVDFSIDEHFIRNYIKLPEDSQSPHTTKTRKPHIVLNQEDILFTSIFLFFRKE
jgi:hypothetical protein